MNCLMSSTRFLTGCVHRLAGHFSLDALVHFRKLEGQYINMSLSFSFFLHRYLITFPSHSYYFGPKSDGGRDFHEAYTGFKRGFALPFSQFVRNAFRK